MLRVRVGRVLVNHPNRIAVYLETWVQRMFSDADDGTCIPENFKA